jgi:hypothetical protein
MSEWNTDSVPNKGESSELHKSLVVHVERPLSAPSSTPTPIDPISSTPSSKDVSGGSSDKLEDVSGTSGKTWDNAWNRSGWNPHGKTWDDVWKRWK